MQGCTRFLLRPGVPRECNLCKGMLVLSLRCLFRKGLDRPRAHSLQPGRIKSTAETACVVEALCTVLPAPVDKQVAHALQQFLKAPWGTLAVVVPSGNVGPLASKSEGSSSPVHFERKLEHQVHVQTFSFVGLQSSTPAFDTPLLQAAADVTDKAVELLQASKATVGKQNHFSFDPVIVASLPADSIYSLGLAGWSSSFVGGASQHQSSNPGGSTCHGRPCEHGSPSALSLTTAPFLSQRLPAFPLQLSLCVAVADRRSPSLLRVVFPKLLKRLSPFSCDSASVPLAFDFPC